MNDNHKKILFHYLYRDDGNWTTYDTVLLSNRKGKLLSDVKQAIRDQLLQGELFITQEVGLKSLGGCEHEWHEYEFIEEVENDDEPLMDVSELIAKLKASKKKHAPAPARIHPLIPMLEFIHQARKILDTLFALCKGSKTVIVFHDDDWNTLLETLEWDSQSAAFDPDIRRDIAKGLKRMKEVNVDDVLDLRFQAARLEKRLKKYGGA